MVIAKVNPHHRACCRSSNVQIIIHHAPLFLFILFTFFFLIIFQYLPDRSLYCLYTYIYTMGQANSTTTKSDLTFGYVSVPPRRRKSKRTTTNSSDDLISSQSHYDLLISSPQLYALSASPTSISDGDTLLESSPSSSSTTNNTCSGTMTTNLDDDWEQLQHVKDVSYIDESYYDDQLFKSTRHELVHDDTCFNGYWWESQDLHSHKQKCMQKRRVRCMDVYRCMDRAMLHMDLCNRRFASITANIACFNSIKRLDL